MEFWHIYHKSKIIVSWINKERFCNDLKSDAALHSWHNNHKFATHMANDRQMDEFYTISSFLWWILNMNSNDIKRNNFHEKNVESICKRIAVMWAMFSLIPQKIRVHLSKCEFFEESCYDRVTTLRSHSAMYMISSMHIFTLTLIKKRVLGYTD